MRTVTFQSVMNAVAYRAGIDPTSGSWTSDLQATVCEFIQAWVRKGWEWAFWPEWTNLEQRWYRLPWSSTTAYAAPALNEPVEVWYPPAQLYAQALQASTNQPPFVEINGAWFPNWPYWELSTGAYSGNAWLPNTLYTAGSGTTPGAIVQNPGDDNFYECITTHTSGSTFDPTKFGILTPFEKYVSLDQPGMTPIGEVQQCTVSNPISNPRFPGPLSFLIKQVGPSEAGVVPAPLAGTSVWLQFRQRPPVFTSVDWVSGQNYGEGAVALDGSAGECYVSLVSSNVANQPSQSPADWQYQPVPFVIAEAVKRGAFAELLRVQAQNEKGDDQEEKALGKLMEAEDVTFGSQGQYDRASAQVYC